MLKKRPTGNKTSGNVFEKGRESISTREWQRKQHLAGVEVLGVAT